MLNIREIAHEKFSLFKRETIHDIIHSTPEILLPPISLCDALEDFLLDRSLQIDEICNAIMSYRNGR